jgi:histone H3/H4
MLRTPFAKVVREVIQELDPHFFRGARLSEIRIQRAALENLQEAAESFLVTLFEGMPTRGIRLSIRR